MSKKTSSVINVTIPGAEASVSRLSKDIVASSKAINANEARFLVDYYYLCQEDRKRFNNQERALSDLKESCLVISWLATQAETLESQIKRALDAYTEAHPIGEWLRSIVGVGPVIAAGLLAHIDIEKAETAGQIWRFAGLDPTSKWEKGQKRPWNGALKTLCWKVGQSFMKFSNHPDCFYGAVYKERKDYEIQRNDNGGNSEAAKSVLPSYSKATESYKWLAGCYPAGTNGELVKMEASKRDSYLKKIALEPGQGLNMLPPAQIDARARRYAVKLFLAHLHEVWYTKHFGKQPPKPYPIAILGHAHKIEPPNFDPQKEAEADKVT